MSPRLAGVAAPMRLLIGLALSVVTLALTGGLLEGAIYLSLDAAAAAQLRAQTGDPPVPKWANHPFLPLVGVPSLTYEVDRLVNGSDYSIKVSNNSYGFRTHEFVEREDDDFIVVCLGGSTTWGEAAPTNAATWPEQLEALLSDRYPQRRVRVYNLGIPTGTSANSLVAFALIASRLHPDVVIVYHGINEIEALLRATKWDYSHIARDLGEVHVPLAKRLPASLQRSLTLLWAASLIDRITSTEDLAGYVVRSPRIPDVLDVALRVVRAGGRAGAIKYSDIKLFFQNLESIEALAAHVGARTLFATFQARDPGPEFTEFNNNLRSWLQAKGKPWVDVDAALPDNDPTINYDECHFTDEGRSRMAHLFFDAIVDRNGVSPRPGTEVPNEPSHF